MQISWLLDADYGMICVKLEADMVQIGMRYDVNRAGFLVVLNKNL